LECFDVHIYLRTRRFSINYFVNDFADHREKLPRTIQKTQDVQMININVWIYFMHE